MNASLLESISLAEQVRALMGEVRQLRQRVEGQDQEIRELRQQVVHQRSEASYWKSMHARAVERCEKVQQKLDEAQAEIRQLKADLYGDKSEKSSGRSASSNQLEEPGELVTDSSATSAEGATSKPKKRRGGRTGQAKRTRRNYSHLPAREDNIDLPPDQKVCEHCGKPLSAHGTCDEVEQIQIEVEAYRRKIRRLRYRRTCQCAGPRTVAAPLPPKLLPKSIYGISIWEHLLLEKFHLQRPTHRTIEQLRLHGLSLAPGTIADGFRRLVPLFVPVYEGLRERVSAASYFHADETRWRVFAEKAGKIGYRWWLWLFSCQDATLYALDPSRSHEVPESHLPKDQKAVLMVDRYSGYKAMSQVKLGQISLAFCWSHVRRDFIRVGKGFSELRPWALAWLKQIRELYRLHRRRKEHDRGTAEFVAADAELRQHMAKMWDIRDAELAQVGLRQPCRKVLDSLSEHGSGLTLFLDDLRVPLDNNVSERMLRNSVVGRKNYYGSGAEWAGRLAMMMFSILSTLRQWRINPQLWLRNYLEACAANQGAPPADVASFLPWNMKAEQLAEFQLPNGCPTGSPVIDTS